jgi:hypothetical protein
MNTDAEGDGRYSKPMNPNSSKPEVGHRGHRENKPRAQSEPRNGLITLSRDSAFGFFEPQMNTDKNAGGNRTETKFYPP